MAVALKGIEVGQAVLANSILPRQGLLYPSCPYSPKAEQVWCRRPQNIIQKKDYPNSLLPATRQLTHEPFRSHIHLAGLMQQSTREIKVLHPTIKCCLLLFLHVYYELPLISLLLRHLEIAGRIRFDCPYALSFVDVHCNKPHPPPIRQ